MWLSNLFRRMGEETPNARSQEPTREPNREPPASTGSAIPTDYSWVATLGDGNHLRYETLIAEGGSGQVHKVYHKLYRNSFARKIVRTVGPNEDIAAREQKAISTLFTTRNQNIVRILLYGPGYYGGGHTRNSPLEHCLYIDMEFCDFNLKTFIHDGTMTTPQSRNLAPLSNILFDRGDTNICRNHWDVMEQISMGVEFLHQCNLVHRDLNPTNVLFSTKDGAWKITDFGFTTQGPTSNNSNVHGLGTQGYRAPEMLKENVHEHTTSVDIWGLGCILYEVAKREPAFPTDTAVRDYAFLINTEASTLLRVDKATNPNLSRLINAALEVQSSRRPSANQLHHELKTVLWQSFGDALETQGNLGGAIQAFNEGIKFNPDYGPLWEGLMKAKVALLEANVSEEKKEVVRLKNALLKTENERRDMQDTLDHKRNAHQAQLNERTGELLRAEESILNLKEQVKNLQNTNRTLSMKSESLESELQERDKFPLRRIDDHVMSFELEDGCTEIDPSREKHEREILDLQSKIDSLQLDHTLELSVAEENVRKLQSSLESLQLSHTQKVSTLEGKVITLQSDLESLKADYAQLSTVEKANREIAHNSQHSSHALELKHLRDQHQIEITKLKSELDTLISSKEQQLTIIEETQRQLNSTTSSERDLLTSNENHKQKVIKLQSELNDLQSTHHEAQSLIANHNQLVLQLEKKHNQEITKLQSDIDALKSSNNEYRTTIEKTNDQLNSMTSSQQELHTSNENHKQKVAKLRSELTDLQSAHHKAQSLIADHDQVVLQLEKKRSEEVTKLQSDLDALKSSNNESRRTIEETHRQLKSSQQDLLASNENHKRKTDKLQSELTNLQTAHRKAQSLIADHNQVVLQLEKKRNEEVAKLQFDLDALKSSDKEHLKTIAETRRQLNSMTSGQQELLAANESHKQEIAKLQSELTNLQTAHRKAQSLIVNHNQAMLKLEERHNQKVADLELQVKQKKDDNAESLQFQVSNLNKQLTLARDQSRAATEQLHAVEEQLQKAQEQLRMPRGMLELVHVQYNQILFKLKDSYERDKIARIATLDVVHRKELLELEQSQIKAHEEITKHYNTFPNVTQQFVEKYRNKKWSKDDRDKAFAKSDEWCEYHRKEQNLRNAYLNLRSAETNLNDNHKEKVSSITAESFESCSAPEIVLFNKFRTTLEPLLSLYEAAPTAGTTS